jgi:hypothetical protein
MHCRPQIRQFSAWVLAFATALAPAAAQPTPTNRDKNTWTYEGGIFLDTEGALPGGACFRVKGRVTSADFFENLKREDTNSGTLFRRGNDLVTEFPKSLHMSLSIADTPCDPHMQQTNSRVYLTDEMIRSLRLHFFWKRAMELRPVKGIVESGGEVRPVPWYSHGLEQELPKRFEWLVEFDVPSEGVPLTDNLVLMMYTPDHRLIARGAARM